MFEKGTVPVQKLGQCGDRHLSFKSPQARVWHCQGEVNCLWSSPGLHPSVCPLQVEPDSVTVHCAHPLLSNPCTGSLSLIPLKLPFEAQTDACPVSGREDSSVLGPRDAAAA